MDINVFDNKGMMLGSVSKAQARHLTRQGDHEWVKGQHALRERKWDLISGGSSRLDGKFIERHAELVKAGVQEHPILSIASAWNHKTPKGEEQCQQ